MASDKITAAHILVPVTLLSFVVALFLGFQTTMLASDRDGLTQASAEQSKPLEQAEKAKAMATNLAVGTLKLAQQGDKNAAEIIDLMKKSGINVSDKPETSGQQGTPAGQPPAGK
ncbi:MAG: hypothetical protein KGI37_06150 [Alphaproteobacteria bacterium]|nr:hypothetical protein [Alphaproteobacteria bacterium]